MSVLDEALVAWAGLSVLAWLGMLLFRGGFWLAEQRLPVHVPDRAEWPAVAAVIPARNEAATVGRTVSSLLSQDYPGEIFVVVVDDDSNDGTAEAAGDDVRLAVIHNTPLEPGWTGKMWAVNRGLGHVREAVPGARYILLTDADIEYDAGVLCRLVAKAEDEDRHLVSLMALLRTHGLWERLLIPAFVFFFQKLYPFPWVNDPRRRIAAAAGGCMLVRAETLFAAGGVRPIRDRVIDDCALGRLIKRHGPIWLGLTREVHSLRPYPRLGEIWNMVARTAFEQLDHSSFMLLGTIVGMLLLYVTPPAAIVACWGQRPPLGALGLAAWVLMAIAYLPTVRHFRQSPVWAATLPVAGVLYTLMTVHSAFRHWQGRGGAWKGRHYGAPRTGAEE